MSGIWGEFLRLRGRLHAAAGRATEAYHDFGQSVSVFELLGERYQAGLSYLELGRLRRVRRRALARDALSHRCRDACSSRSAPVPDSPRRAAGAQRVPVAGTGATSASRWMATMRWCGGSWTPRRCRRCSRAKGPPRCSRRATARPRSSSCSRHARAGPRVLAAPAATHDSARGAGGDAHASPAGSRALACIEPIGRDADGARFAVVSSARAAHARPSAAAVPHAVRRAAAGIRSVPGARAPGRSGRRARSSGSSSRCCPGSSARAPRCSASPIRSSGCRATT